MSTSDNITEGSDDFDTLSTNLTNNFISPMLPPRTPDFTVFVETIANLLYCNVAGFVTTPPESVRSTLKVLFQGLGINTWHDLQFCKLDTISKFYENNNISTDNKLSVRDQLALLYVFRYSCFKDAIPEPGTLMNKIVCEVQGQEKGHQVQRNLPPSPSCSQKIDVPAPKQFRGTDEDAYGWIEDTLNTMGQAGLSAYLTDKTICQHQPEIATRVFYSLREATMNGIAKHVSQNLVDTKSFCPYTLWQELTKFYDTHVNKANIILHEVKKLISLKLHAGNSPTQFISDWRECLQRLEKQGSLLPKDTDTL